MTKIRLGKDLSLPRKSCQVSLRWCALVVCIFPTCTDYHMLTQSPMKQSKLFSVDCLRLCVRQQYLGMTAYLFPRLVFHLFPCCWERTSKHSDSQSWHSITLCFLKSVTTIRTDNSDHTLEGSIDRDMGLYQILLWYFCGDTPEHVPSH